VGRSARSLASALQPAATCPRSLRGQQQLEMLRAERLLQP
jgi:hypothetical protein